MTIGEAVLFGAVQGLTEFLPVSSSGHLAVLKALLDIGDVPILFDVILHVATLVVVIVVFRQRVGRILASIGRFIVRRSRESDATDLRLTWVIIIATVVTAAIGLGVNELDVGVNPQVVSALFIVTGLILIASRFLHGSRDYAAVGVKDGLMVGIGQGLGVFPGISRSGITITASLAAGLDRERAGEFAFLVSIPAILGAFVLTLRDAAELSESVGFAALAVGFVTALVVGLLAILLLLRLVKRGKLFYFAFYLIPAGIVGLILL
jgi:undecaprenyl-diphosphatase